MATNENSAQGAPKSFDVLHRELQEICHHLLLADQVLFDFNETPGNLQPAATVLHRAAVELDKLEEEFDRWYVHHEHTPRTDLEADTGAAPTRTEREAEFLRLVRPLPTEAKDRLMAAMRHEQAAAADARWPQHVEGKLISAKSIVQAVVAAESSGNLEGANYDASYPLKVAVDLIECALNQLDLESMARSQEGAS